jgi:hypothetical protein
MHPLDLSFISDPITAGGKQYTACVGTIYGMNDVGGNEFEAVLGDVFLRNVYSLCVPSFHLTVLIEVVLMSDETYTDTISGIHRPMGPPASHTCNSSHKQTLPLPSQKSPPIGIALWLVYPQKYPQHNWSNFSQHKILQSLLQILTLRLANQPARPQQSEDPIQHPLRFLLPEKRTVLRFHPPAA